MCGECVLLGYKKGAHVLVMTFQLCLWTFESNKHTLPNKQLKAPPINSNQMISYILKDVADSDKAENITQLFSSANLLSLF